VKRAVLCLVLAAACGNKSAAPLCEPWKGYGIPAPDKDLQTCAGYELIGSYQTLRDKALVTAVGDAFARAGFQQVSNGGPRTPTTRSTSARTTRSSTSCGSP
jgi:hypothetical protein